jgi:tripartite-type tricarboxylate transporter receptor subunit TctC
MLAGASHAVAQAWPTKPAVMLVPQAPGGTNDIVARLIATELGTRLGQAFVVDNRPGAGGNIGTSAAAKSAPDGYTVLMTISSSQAINPSLYKSIPFDPVKDFEPVAPIASVPNVLVVNPAFPAKSMQELIAMAKAKPGEYRFASAGNGTLNHLLGEMLNSMAGIKLEHVPYKGVAPALNDVLGNQVPIAFASLPSVIGQLKGGKLRALGVSSAKRNPALPDVPAIAETVPGYSGDLWVALFAVKGTPPEITNKLAAAVTHILADRKVHEKLEAQGALVLTGSPATLAATLKQDIDRWAAIVKSSGATVD